MFKNLPITIALWGFSWMVSYAQDSDFKPNGAFNGKIYANFNSSIKNSEPTTGFDVRRAYFGYKHNLTENFSMALKLDIGSPDDLSDYSRIRRYAYFKTAAAYYKKSNFTIGFGLTDTYQFKLQNSFWRKHYLYKNIAEENSFGPSADIGLVLVKKWEKISADISLFNGEGYKETQNDNSFKGTFGLSYMPNNNWILRIYGDLMSKTISESTIVGFVGYKRNKYSIGLEGTLKQNENFISGNQRFGISTFGAFQVFPKIDVFGRYDYIESNIPDGESIPWNLSKDGSALITGIEYNPIKDVRIALNYQDWVPLATNVEMESTLFVNIEVSF